jgi:hypothetical protein
MAEFLTIQALTPVTFLVALLLFVAGSFGGGIEAEHVRIPPLHPLSRALCFITGAALLGLCFILPRFLPSSGSAQTPAPAPTIAPSSGTPGCPNDKPGAWRGADIENGIITVQDVKRVLRHAGFFSGPMNECADPDFHKAVAAFQLSQSLKADGYVGPDTYAKLQAAWPDFVDVIKK